MNQSSIKRSLPVRFLTIAVMLTELFIVALGSSAYLNYQKFQASEIRALRVIELQGIIMRLDEVLTMSARMAAATGNPDWETRYKKFEPELDAAIQEAIRLDPDSYTGESAKATDNANVKLVEMEHQSFDWVRKGGLKEAQGILFSPEYEKHKKIYAEGMSQFIDHLKEGLSKGAAKDSRRNTIQIIIMAGVALLLLAGWILVLKAMQTWEQKLVRANQELREKTQELNELNKTLDDKVKARTEELEHSRNILLQSEKMAAIGQLAGGVAHEINNPLGVILGFAQNVAKRVQPGDPLQMPLKSIEREAIRCKNLVQDLLTFSRVGKAENESVDLKEAIEGALSLVLAQSKVKNVDLEKDFSEVPRIQANKNQIQQVIVNLSNNAMDAMPEGGKLFVRLKKTKIEDKDAVEIQVQDTGQGIPEEIRSKVFNPFFTTKEIGKGTGLGLSLVYEIVQKHKGRILLESETGAGTTFRIFFPLKG